MAQHNLFDWREPIVVLFTDRDRGVEASIECTGLPRREREDAIAFARARFGEVFGRTPEECRLVLKVERGSEATDERTGRPDSTAAP
jgi:hypothetical protein